MATVEFHWNRPQSLFLTIGAEIGGPAQFVDFEGAVRAGKSTPAVVKLCRYAAKYPGIHMAAARWTQDGLDAQVKPLWRQVAYQRGLRLQWHADEEYDEILPYGSRVYLRALRSSEDSMRYGKLAGLTLAVLWIDQPEEISNADEDVVLAYVPARLSQPGYPHEAWFTPNPVGHDHWLGRGTWFPTDLVKPNYHYIHTSIYDNRRVLGDAYIADMEDKHPVGTALRKRFVDGERGLGVVGEPIYAGYFHRALRKGGVVLPWHVRDDVRVDRRFPLYEAWDFGYEHPAVLWSQFVQGQWRILGELMGTRQGIAAMADWALDLRQQLFPGVFRVESVCDPSGFAHSGQGHAQTAAEILQDKGVVLAGRDSVKHYNVPQTEYNAIQATMALMRKANEAGDPQFVVHPSCETFITGLEAGYIWSDKQYAGSAGSVRVADKRRDTEYNHLQDCWLYTLLRWGSASMTYEQAARMQSRIEAAQTKRAQRDMGESYDIRLRQLNRRPMRGGY